MTVMEERFELASQRILEIEKEKRMGIVFCTGTDSIGTRRRPAR